MRDIFTEIFENQPLDPREAARRGARPQLRKRFYSRAHVGEGERRLCAAARRQAGQNAGAARRSPPRARALAEKLAGEWNAQAELIDPGRMPLTRLANAVIDAVADAPRPVADEVAKYLGSDLLCYRAEAPARPGRAAGAALGSGAGLGARRARRPLRAGAGRHARGAAEAKPSPPRAQAFPHDPWRLGAVSSITTLTGSGLLALALDAGALDADAAWAAAHVDEDWQMSQWGRDEPRSNAARFVSAEFEAAVAVLRHAP